MLTLNELFPESGRVLLTGTGIQFIERLGVEAVRNAILSVMMGENIRSQTEPLTQRRIAQLSCALVTLFVHGWLNIPGFTDNLPNMAISQINASIKSDKAQQWPAQWILGLTGKSVQNVLRGRAEALEDYVSAFEQALDNAAVRAQADLGNLVLSFGFIEDEQGRKVELGWRDLTRLTTAIGSLTLTIRGSDKSMFGKLFERLVLGSVLTTLGFQRVDARTNTQREKIFWLSDSRASRESDATLLFRPGKLARFDIGFIGRGNPEISKDKLSRYARELELAGEVHSSTTFIIVDRLPDTTRTIIAAQRIGAEIIQMSMQYWPRTLAQRLGERLGFEHELQTMPDEQIPDYLRSKLATIPVQAFLADVSVEEIETSAEDESNV
jgi:hypothetical protein